VVALLSRQEKGKGRGGCNSTAAKGPGGRLREGVIGRWDGVLVAKTSICPPPLIIFWSSRKKMQMGGGSDEPFEEG